MPISKTVAKRLTELRDKAQDACREYAEALREIADEQRAEFDERSEKWQESEKGQEAEARIEALEEAADEAESVEFEILGLD